MFTIKKIDHVAVCVNDIDAAAAKYKEVFGLGRDAAGDRRLAEDRGGAPPDRREQHRAHLAARQRRAREVPGEARAGAPPHRDRGGGDRGRARVPEGLGVPLIDETPRAGARGHKVAFVHPKATGGVLVELVEPAGGETAPL